MLPLRQQLQNLYEEELRELRDRQRQIEEANPSVHSGRLGDAGRNTLVHGSKLPVFASRALVECSTRRRPRSSRFRRHDTREKHEYPKNHPQYPVSLEAILGAEIAVFHAHPQACRAL